MEGLSGEIYRSSKNQRRGENEDIFTKAAGGYHEIGRKKTRVGKKLVSTPLRVRKSIALAAQSLT